MELPKDRLQYSTLNTSIVTFFADRNISVIDTSDGVVNFKRDCSMMGKQAELQSLFLHKIQTQFPNILIESKPNISTKSSLPADFERYELIDVVFNETSLKRNNGSFAAIFKVAGKERKLFFAYEMDAKAKVFKAKRNLLNGTIITNDDFETVYVSLEQVPNRALSSDSAENLVAKSNIKEGQIVLDFQCETKKVLHKKEMIKALYKEDGLVIELRAMVLDDANVGDIIRIKTEQGKVLSAKVISSKEVVITE